MKVKYTDFWTDREIEYTKEVEHEGDTIGKLPYRICIKYLDDEKLLDRIEENKLGDYEPWEVYKYLYFDSLSEAIETYMKYYMADYILDISMYVDQVDKSIPTFEERVEPQYGTRALLRQIVNNDMKKKLNDTEREVGKLKEELENIHRFINSNKFILDMYKEFLQKDK